MLDIWHDLGFEIYVYGFMDSLGDPEGIFPYSIQPTPPMDELGHHTCGFFLRKVKPDVIFILTDPGNIAPYAGQMYDTGIADWKRDGQDYRPPVVVYTPIESRPSPVLHGEGLYLVEELGGKVVVYCQSAKEMITDQFPDLRPDVVFHGHDHAPFAQFKPEERKLLRRLAGLDDYFMVGNVGVNKRTKGITTLIYAAVELRKMRLDEGIKFYCHTNPTKSTMDGYHLRDLTKYYGVADMFLFKQELQSSYWKGVPYDNGTLQQCLEIGDKVPETPEGRGYLWGHFDLISKYNCFDLYADCSQIEGWGLGMAEAMACGVPCLSVNDNHVRQEIHSAGAYMMQPSPFRMWDTWHTDMRLVHIDPLVVAEHILMFKNDAELRKAYSKKGYDFAHEYKWADSANQMAKIINDTYERHLKIWQMSL